MNKGVLFAISAYVFWGLHPIYWKQLRHVPSVEIIAYRILWSMLFFSVIITLTEIQKIYKKYLDFGL